ncbi:MAG TPA: DUF86 domain-containing protein [Candidatus Latescibacteria bacterium]|nr:DUF86 domain-containing protein [Candidatus Latescibacterota bacterium]HOS65364.1 DUF86 domain-containing protein [Candidatus Latescibacterota bacterium]HQI76691.1 DUF86 domain-containing protein [Candidatus Latescibacterota bacterium]HRS96458.1 DUF86 domain-containing protein [Candidatus Latescibacterota bacterium]HRU23013.1 DUF86 domain-containing protein [Candidatus Latescibacterota bacterium]
MRSDRERLLDALDAISRIREKVTEDLDSFLADEMVQVWVTHHLEILGESIARLSDELKTHYPRVPWSRAVAMRNILVHHYFSVDPRQVWNTVANDLPKLQRDLEAILKSMPEEST